MDSFFCKSKLSVFLVITCFVQNFSIAQNKIPVEKTPYQEVSDEVISHFKKTGEPQKLDAAYFLLKNIPIHHTKETVWVDKNFKKIPFNETDYNSVEEASEKLNQLIKEGAQQEIDKVWDKDTISANYLIATVDDAFKSWKNNPWSKQYNFETFCEYILPYRSDIEVVSPNWKNDFRLALGDFKSNVGDLTDPQEVLSAVLGRMKHFEFIRSDKNPNKQILLSASQLMFRKEGTCLNLTHAALLASRAHGLAVTFDFVPFHASSSGRHFWNTIVDADGAHIPFNGTSNEHVAIETGKRIGKVLRKTFSTNKNSLAFKIPKEAIPHPIFEHTNYIDVTEDYVDTSDIEYNYSATPQYKVGLLTIYNRGNWRPFWWGQSDVNGKVTFKNMGRNIVYLPANFADELSESKSIVLEPYPLVLNKKGGITLLKPDFSTTYSCDLNRRNETQLKTTDFNTVELIDGEAFTLFYWDSVWKKIGEQTVEEETLHFDQLPKNALFKLLPKEPDGFERIFTINPDNCEISWF